MNPKTLVLIATTFGCGVVTVIGILQARQGSQTQEPLTIRVLVATTDIQPGIELNDHNVHFVEMPVNLVPEDAVTSPEQYEDHAPIFGVQAQDIIRESRLGKRGETTTTNCIFVPAGMRVISVAANVPDWSGRPGPGDVVDVLVTYQALNEHNVIRTRTRTLLEFVEVFAIDDQTVSDGDLPPGIRAGVVHLLVTPEQVDSIRLAESEGELHLVLRHAVDSE